MKHLKLFESFSEENIHDICREYGIENYTINEDGSIDVEGNVNLVNMYLTKLPLNFRNVTGYFKCGNNHLTTLEGCPKSVGGVFSCYSNNLTSLKGCPEFVGKSLDCRHNKITTFEHFPISMGGYLWCVANPINEVWKLFEDYYKIEFLNDCDPIREPDDSEEPIIILDRLNYFLKEIGKPTVTEVKGYKCI